MFICGNWSGKDALTWLHFSCSLKKGRWVTAGGFPEWWEVLCWSKEKEQKENILLKWVEFYHCLWKKSNFNWHKIWWNKEWYFWQLYQIERQIIQTVKTKDNAHDNGLGVGRSANMGDFNPFFLKCTRSTLCR